jgi:chorismate mutase
MAARRRRRRACAGAGEPVKASDGIGGLRRRIDELDERLVELLNERARCALTIGEQKQVLGLEIYQPDREAEVLRHVRAHGAAIQGPLGPEALTRLFERIIDEARRLERESAVRHGRERSDAD